MNQICSLTTTLGSPSRRSLSAILLLFLFTVLTSARAIDSGLTDSIWKMVYNVKDAQMSDPAWLAADDDRDGISNGAERAAGTDPFSAGSTVKISSMTAASGTVSLTFPTIANKQYFIQSTTNLGNSASWLPLGSSLPPVPATSWVKGDGTSKALSLPQTPNTFYRVVVQDLDSDGDGVGDWAESIAGFDPANANTSGVAGGNDLAAVTAAVAASNVVTVMATKPNATQPPDLNTAPVETGSITVSRSGLLLSTITVPLLKSGTALEGQDYDPVGDSASNYTSVTLAGSSLPYDKSNPGANKKVSQVVLTINPRANGRKTNVTAIVKALAANSAGGSGNYTLGSAVSGSVVINPAGVTNGTGLTAAYYQGGSSTYSSAVNFGGTTGISYSYSSSTGLATISAAGFTAANQVKLQFTNGSLSGGAFDVVYTISTAVQTSFTVPVSGAVTGSGTCVLNPPVLTRVDPGIDFSAYSASTNPTGWGAGSNGANGTAYPITTANTAAAGAKYCVRWTGQVLPQYSEAYTFDFKSDDGAKVWVDGVLLIDKWVGQGATDWVGTINLQAGVPYDIQIDHYNGGGGGEAHLYWWSPSQTKQAIPSSRLFPAPAQSTKVTAITSNLSAVGYVGVPFNFTVTTPNIGGGTIVFLLDANSGPLPPALPNANSTLSLNSVTGQITGTPTVAGTYNVAINSINPAAVPAGTVTGSSALNIKILPAFGNGSVTREILTTNADGTITATANGTISTLDDDTDYGDGTARRLRGYIVPPKTGNYYFWLAASNSAELWISNDSEYVNRVRRATVTSSTGKKVWNASLGTQQTPWISLVAGQKYYFDVLHYTGAVNDDYVAMGWCQDDVGTIPSTASAPNSLGATPLIPNTGLPLQGYPLSGTVPSYIFQPFDYPTVTPPTGTLYAANLGPQGASATKASGAANIQVDQNETQAILHFSYQNLTSPRTAYHLHVDAFDNHPQGEIIFDIDEADVAPGIKTADGGYIWAFSPTGTFTNVAQIVDAIHKGKVYVNVHSVIYPAGEIRGNLTLIDGSQTPPNPTKYPEPTATDSATTTAGAARFLNHATFGASPTDVAYVKNYGFAGWINTQLTKSPTYTSNTVVAGATADINQPYPSRLFTDTWWKNSITAEDQLRQRLAFALSEIMVVSWNNDTGPLQQNGRILADYYDQLVDYVLPPPPGTLVDDRGTFRGILKAVTLTPAMGLYLDMRANQKGDDSLGRHPNENYAREIMQLFSVGIYRLWDDGRYVLGSDAGIVATYSQAQILGLSALFTGWNYAQSNQANGRLPSNFSPSADYLNPMVLVPSQHDLGPKLLLNNVLTPAATGRTPRVTISSISTGNPCTITTTLPHSLKTGDTVYIFSVANGSFTGGYGAINAAFTATVPAGSSTTFTVPVECTAASSASGLVTGSTVTSLGSSSVTIASIGQGSPCTVNTATAHGLRTGDTVVISGVTKGAYTGGTGAINSSFIVGTVPTSLSFTIPVTCTSTAGSGGTAAGALTSVGVSTSGIFPLAGSQSDNNGSGSPHPYDQYGLTELERAIDNIVSNDNVPPYICRQLIQRFVTSDPSPGYLYRVVQKFKNNGSGVRGDMVAVIKQILLDGEARSNSITQNSTTFGKQREPLLRLSGPARAFPPGTGYLGTYTQLSGIDSNKLRITTSTQNDFSSSFNVNLDFHGNYTPVSQTLSPSTVPTSTSYSVQKTLGITNLASSDGTMIPFGANTSVGNPCVITTSTPHALDNGAAVTITGVTSGTYSPTVNGTFSVTVIDSTHFSVPVNCTASSTSFSLARVTPHYTTVTTALPHGLVTGNSATITGVSSGTFVPSINDAFTVTVIDPTNFRVPVKTSGTPSFATAQIVGATTLDVLATGMVNATYYQQANSADLVVNTAGPATDVLVPGNGSVIKSKVYLNFLTNVPTVALSSFQTTISAIGLGNGTSSVVTTTQPHGLVTGNTVTITGVTGGTFTPAITTTSLVVTVINATQFSVLSNCTVLPTSLSSARAVSNPCRITTSVSHGLTTGDVVVISGVTGGTFKDPSTGLGANVNGSFAVTVVDPTSFTIPLNCTLAPTSLTSALAAFSIASTPGSNGVYDVAVSVNGSNTFTVQTTGNLSPGPRVGNVLIPKIPASYTPLNGNSVIQVNTNVNHNLVSGSHAWVDAPVVSTPLADGEYVMDTLYNTAIPPVVVGLTDEDHYTTSYLPVTSSLPGAAYVKPVGSNNGITIWPLVPPPLGRSGVVSIDSSTFSIGSTEATLTQSPLNSPTVFNFFFPNYRFPGSLANSGLDSPEFQLTTDSNVMNLTNSITNMVIGTGGANGNLNGLMSFNNGNGSVVLSVEPYINQASDARTSESGVSQLIDDLADLLVGAPLEPATKTTILNFVNHKTGNVLDYLPYTVPTAQQKRDRVRAIIQLILTSPEYAVQK